MHKQPNLAEFTRLLEASKRMSFGDCLERSLHEALKYDLDGADIERQLLDLSIAEKRNEAAFFLTWRQHFVRLALEHLDSDPFALEPITVTPRFIDENLD